MQKKIIQRPNSKEQQQEQQGQQFTLNKKATFAQRNIVEDRNFYMNVRSVSTKSKVNAGQKINTIDFSLENKSIDEMKQLKDEKDQWAKYMKLQEICLKQQDSNEKNNKEQYRQHINIQHQDMIDQKKNNKLQEIKDSKQEQQNFRDQYNNFKESENKDKQNQNLYKQQLLQMQKRDLKNRKHSNKKQAKQTKLDNTTVVQQSLDFMQNKEHKYTKEQTNNILMENIKQNQKSYLIKQGNLPTLQNDKIIANKFFDHNSKNLQKELDTQKNIIKSFQLNCDNTLKNVMGDSKFIINEGSMKKVHYDVRNEKGLTRKHQLQDIKENKKQSETQQFYSIQKQQLGDRKQQKDNLKQEKEQEKKEQNQKLKVIIEQVNDEKMDERKQELKKKKAYFEELNEQLREQKQRKESQKNKMHSQDLLINKNAIDKIEEIVLNEPPRRNNLY